MKKLSYRMMLMALLGLMLMITSVVSAQEDGAYAHDDAYAYGDYITTKVILDVKSSTTIAPVVSESTGDQGALSPSTSAIQTRTVRVRRTFRSLVGLTVATHDATTWWTFGNNQLFPSPRGMANDWWTLPPTFVSGHSAQWDWYHVGLRGTGRSNMQATFVFGVPTPWGPVGSTFSSRIFTTVRADGSFAYHSP